MSPDYHGLCKRLSALRRHLLPQISPTGAYTDSESDRTRAFIALSHAEIESFIEIRCTNVANAAKTNWFTHRRVNGIIFSLYTICYSGWAELQGDFRDLPKLETKADIEKRIVSCLDQYKHVISSNHGIREPYLRKLLVPLSIRMSDLDANWVLEMTNFGGLRGQIAHMSGKANQPPDPEAFDKLIRKVLLPGLKALDQRLSSLVGAATPPLQRNGAWHRIKCALQLIRTGYP